MSQNSQVLKKGGEANSMSPADCQVAYGFVSSTEATVWDAWDGAQYCKVVSLLPWALASSWEETRVESKLVSIGIPNQSYLCALYCAVRVGIEQVGLPL